MGVSLVVCHYSMIHDSCDEEEEDDDDEENEEEDEEDRLDPAAIIERE